MNIPVTCFVLLFDCKLPLRQVAREDEEQLQNDVLLIGKGECRAGDVLNRFGGTALCVAVVEGA